MLDKAVGPEGVTQAQERPFVCPTCGATFTVLKGLKGHQAGKHGAAWGLAAEVRAMSQALQEGLDRVDKTLRDVETKGLVRTRVVDEASYKAFKDFG